MMYRNTVKILNNIYFHEKIEFTKDYLQNFLNNDNKGEKIIEYKNAYISNLKEICKEALNSELKENYISQLDFLKESKTALEKSISTLEGVWGRDSRKLNDLNKELTSTVKKINKIEELSENNVKVSVDTFNHIVEQLAKEHLLLFEYLKGTDNVEFFRKHISFRELRLLYVKGKFSEYIREVDKGLTLVSESIDVFHLMDYLTEHGWNYIVDNNYVEKEDELMSKVDFKKLV